MKKKRAVLRATEGMSEREAARTQGIPRWTLNDWRKSADDIFDYKGSEKTLSRAPGRRELAPFGIELIAFMKDTRRDSEVLTAKTMASFVRDVYRDWLESYIQGKKDTATAYESLLRLLRRFAYRHDFVQRTPSGLKEKLSDLIVVRDEFAQSFKKTYSGFDASEVYNTDETGIYYDTPPSTMLSERGKSASITAEQKHSARLTAVCTICADGRKLPLLFILRGEPGGKIEQSELQTYPKGHVYTVQKKEWMDSRVWLFYLRSLLYWHISSPSLLLVDNLDCHVSEESEDVLADEMLTILQPLPKNSTSVCQALDVGVMGPLKSKLKALWMLERPPPLRDGEKRAMKTVKDKRLETIKRTIKAWDEIEPDTIIKSFNKALLTNF
ncbi:hypothetical protein PF002_g9542 [Phytophthora fragariae]|nr:hypothetical protein PF002_g9542 [Phytophthora fragariae]